MFSLPRATITEHNFGHGQAHLSTVLLTLNLLTFLFHTVVHLLDRQYQQIRRLRGTRQGFFNDVQALTKYLLFDTWQHLMEFMLDGLELHHAPNTS